MLLDIAELNFWWASIAKAHIELYDILNGLLLWRYIAGEDGRVQTFIWLLCVENLTRLRKFAIVAILRIFVAVRRWVKQCVGSHKILLLLNFVLAVDWIECLLPTQVVVISLGGFAWTVSNFYIQIFPFWRFGRGLNLFLSVENACMLLLWVIYLSSCPMLFTTRKSILMFRNRSRRGNSVFHFYTKLTVLFSNSKDDLNFIFIYAKIK